jgi:virginiamycin A acetyltransferase
MNRQPNTFKDILIGNDVWVGKGAIILAGSTIPDGVVIGANSVVLPSFEFDAYCIYAGNPVRRIRAR